MAYDVQDALLKYTITDGIHGEAEIILKGDYEGFTIFGFDGDPLMEKNALSDIDIIFTPIQIKLGCLWLKLRIGQYKTFIYTFIDIS